MKRIRREQGWFGALLFLGALNLYGESPQNTRPPGSTPPPSQIQRVQVFDDRVFDLSTDKTAPTTTKSSTTGAERYLADEPDFNSGQRNEALQKCSGATTSQEQRECYQKQMDKVRNRVREKVNNQSDDLRSPWQGDERRGKGLPKE